MSKKIEIYAELGIALQLVIEDRDRVITFDFLRAKKDQVLLCSNGSGTALFLFYAQERTIPTVQTLDKHQNALNKASKLYERWSDLELDTINSYGVRDKKLINAGRVISITYRSDKWTGNNTDYIHTFKKPPIVKMDDLDEPEFIQISGGKLKVQPRGIVG